MSLSVSRSSTSELVGIGNGSATSFTTTLAKGVVTAGSVQLQIPAYLVINNLVFISATPGNPATVGNNITITYNAPSGTAPTCTVGVNSITVGLPTGGATNAAISQLVNAQIFSTYSGGVRGGTNENNSIVFTVIIPGHASDNNNAAFATTNLANGCSNYDIGTADTGGSFTSNGNGSTSILQGTVIATVPTLPSTTIVTASTTGFPATGTIYFASSTGLQTFVYTSLSGGTTFNGTSQGSGTVLLGTAVGTSNITYSSGLLVVNPENSSGSVILPYGVPILCQYNGGWFLPGTSVGTLATLWSLINSTLQNAGWQVYDIISAGSDVVYYSEGESGLDAIFIRVQNLTPTLTLFSYQFWDNVGHGGYNTIGSVNVTDSSFIFAITTNMGATTASNKGPYLGPIVILGLPINPGSVIISTTNPSQSATDAAANGVLSGIGGTVGYINYETGDVTITWGTSPTSGSTQTVMYNKAWEYIIVADRVSFGGYLYNNADSASQYQLGAGNLLRSPDGNANTMTDAVAFTAGANVTVNFATSNPALLGYNIGDQITVVSQQTLGPSANVIPVFTSTIVDIGTNSITLDRVPDGINTGSISGASATTASAARIGDDPSPYSVIAAANIINFGLRNIAAAVSAGYSPWPSVTIANLYTNGTSVIATNGYQLTLVGGTTFDFGSFILDAVPNVRTNRWQMARFNCYIPGNTGNSGAFRGTLDKHYYQSRHNIGNIFDMNQAVKQTASTVSETIGVGNAANLSFNHYLLGLPISPGSLTVYTGGPTLVTGESYTPQATLTGSLTTYTHTTVHLPIPGSVIVTIGSTTDPTYVIMDDNTGLGTLHCPNVITKGSVNYATGAITFTLSSLPVSTPVYPGTTIGAALNVQYTWYGTSQGTDGGLPTTTFTSTTSLPTTSLTVASTTGFPTAGAVIFVANSPSTSVSITEALPATTITVLSTTGFPTAGIISFQTMTRNLNFVYTSTTGTSFTGASQGIGAVLAGTPITFYSLGYSTIITVAPTSPTTTLTVTSTAEFPATGTVYFYSSTGLQVFTYTTISSATVFTGSSQAFTGTVSVGAIVQMAIGGAQTFNYTSTTGTTFVSSTQQGSGSVPAETTVTGLTGIITGANLTGSTVNYITGILTLSFTSAPGNTVPVTCVYTGHHVYQTTTVSATIANNTNYAIGPVV